MAKLHARIGVDGVVYAAMAGSKAAQHLAVGGIHNGVDRKGGNVALPEIEARLYREQIGKPCDTPLCKALLQVRILYPKNSEPAGSGGRTFMRPRKSRRLSKRSSGIRMSSYSLRSAKRQWSKKWLFVGFCG